MFESNHYNVVGLLNYTQSSYSDKKYITPPTIASMGLEVKGDISVAPHHHVGAIASTKLVTTKVKEMSR